MATLHQVTTPALEVAYEESGPPNGLPVVLMHGWPFDVRAFDEVIPHLTTARLRVIAPYLRGYGPTRFLSASTMRSGEQAALGKDLLDLLDALKIDKALLAGFDWGGRAACVVAALWPERVHGLVTCTGYQIQDIANASDRFEGHGLAAAPALSGDPGHDGLYVGHQLAELDQPVAVGIGVAQGVEHGPGEVAVGLAGC